MVSPCWIEWKTWEPSIYITPFLENHEAFMDWSDLIIPCINLIAAPGEMGSLTIYWRSSDKTGMANLWIWLPSQTQGAVKARPKSIGSGYWVRPNNFSHYSSLITASPLYETYSYVFGKFEVLGTYATFNHIK